jgi:hypothetical protein
MLLFVERILAPEMPLRQVVPDVAANPCNRPEDFGGLPPSIIFFQNPIESVRMQSKRQSQYRSASLLRSSNGPFCRNDFGWEMFVAKRT